MRDKIPSKPITVVQLPALHREAEIFLLKPSLRFYAKSGEFHAEGASKEQALEALTAKLDVPALDWKPMINYTLEFSLESVQVSLGRIYAVKHTQKKCTNWLTSHPQYIVSNWEISLDSDSDRRNNQLPLPDLTDDMRRTLTSRKQGLHDIPHTATYEDGYRFQSLGRHHGYVPYTPELWSKLLLLQDCILRAGVAIKLLLTTDEGMKQVLAGTQLFLK